MECRAFERGAGECGAVECEAVECGAVEWGAVECGATDCKAVGVELRSMGIFVRRRSCERKMWSLLDLK